MGDTIYALASAQGKAGVAVIRISGPDSDPVLEALAGAAPLPRQTRLCILRDATGMVLDHALVLRFAQGASFTGEETVEIQCHGSIAVVAALLRAIGETGRARGAEPGEFTRRALQNERLDLTQVQGLADIIDAETEAQRRHAMDVYGGAMAETVADWRRRLMRAMALLEATIDFADEEVPEDVGPEVAGLIEGLRTDVAAAVAGWDGAARLKQGFEVALIGAPNSGKSSLINALTQMDAAIVSEYAGTTRDVIEVRMDVRGIPVTILDTAGLRATEDPIETIGVARARMRAARADLRVLLSERLGPTEGDDLMRVGDLRRRTKSDLHGGAGISALTGEGISDLLSSIHEGLSGRVASAGLFSRERDRVTLLRVNDALRDALSDNLPDELVAALLRDAARMLSGIVGGIDIEDVLDEIFASFCLGK